MYLRNGLSIRIHDNPRWEILVAPEWKSRAPTLRLRCMLHFLSLHQSSAQARRMRNSASTHSQPSAVITGPPYTRLHITPLDPQLLKVIVPSAVLPNIRGLSYHSIQTFPDKPFGFFELPTADAIKIKNKLNGAVLKGAKIRIEPARPAKMPTPTEDAVVDHAAAIEARPHQKKTKKDRKRKRDALEVPGVELEEGRKVKRGWTVTPEEATSKKKKDKAKGKEKNKDEEGDDTKSVSNKEKRKRRVPESLYTEGPECLVKTLLPPNKRHLADIDGGKAKKRTKKGQQQGLLVHEFSRNTKFATFLKTTHQPGPEQAASTFVKGQGWVDANGAVVEDVKTTRPTAFPKIQVERRPNVSPEPVAEDDTSSSDGSNDTSSDDESDIEIDTSSGKRQGPVPRHGGPGEEEKVVSADVARPKSSSSARSLTINIPPATPSSGNVHPLEALYKRHKQDETVASQAAATSEPFTFGGVVDDVGDEDNAGPGESDGHVANENESPYRKPRSQPPMTPFTKQDLEWRNVRSAAPTPDTAHPSRVSRLWFPREDDDALGDVEEENEDDGSDSEGAPPGHRSGDNKGSEGASNNAPADFQKLFWERRAELNRSWKKRRRMSAKEKRYRENRARADRAI